MMRPVTTAWSPGWLVGEAASIPTGAGVGGTGALTAGTRSTGCTLICTVTGAPVENRRSAFSATHTCSGPRSEATASRPLASTVVTVPATSTISGWPLGTAVTGPAGCVVWSSTGGAGVPDTRVYW